MKWKWIEIGIHILFWTFCLWMLNQNFAIETVEIQEVNGERQEVFTRNQDMLFFFIMLIASKALVFYVNVNCLLPKFFKVKKLSSYALELACLFFVAFTLEFSVNYLHTYISELASIQYFQSMLPLNAVLYLSFAGISMGYGFGKNWWQGELNKQKIIKEKLTAELNFLKSQINPHFLFNTLNNLYALSERKNNKELSKGLSQLSNLMRYMLYECQANRVEMEREIQFIQGMIEIQELRLDEGEAAISFQINGNVKGKQIAPLILSPFVENAFKHGIRYGEKSVIIIEFEIENEKLVFQVKNTSFNKIEEQGEAEGIGLENTKRRLELSYPGKHLLKISDEDEIHQVILEIILQ